jgi:hypothetical protein
MRMNDSEHNLIFDVIEQLRSVGLNNMAQDVYNASVNVDLVRRFANSISQADLNAVVSNLQETYLKAIKELTEHYNVISDSKREADINEVQHKFNFLKPENKEVRFNAYLYNRMNDLSGKIQGIYNKTLDNFKQSTSDFKRVASDNWNKFVNVMDKAKKSFSLGKDFFISKWKREYYGACMKIHTQAMINCQKWINHFEAAEKIVNRAECKLNDMFYKMANSQVNIRANNVVNAVRGKEFISNIEVKPKHFKLADLFRKGFNKGILHFKNKFKANYEVMQNYLNKTAAIPNTVYSVSLKGIRGGEIYGIYNKLDENSIDFDVKEKDGIGYLIFKSKEDFTRAFDVVNNVRSVINGVNVETEVNTFDNVSESVEPEKIETIDTVQDVVEDINEPVIEEIVPAEYVESIDNAKEENTADVDDKDISKENDKDVDLSANNYIHLDLSDNDLANAVCEIADKYDIDYSKEGTSLYLNETEENSRNFNMVCEEAQAYVSDKKLNNYHNSLPGIKIHSSAEESIRENDSKLMDVSGNTIGIRMEKRYDNYLSGSTQIMSSSIIKSDDNSTLSIIKNKTLVEGIIAEENILVIKSSKQPDGSFIDQKYEYIYNLDENVYSQIKNGKVMSAVSSDDNEFIELHDDLHSIVKEKFESDIEMLLPRFKSINANLDEKEVNILENHYDSMMDNFKEVTKNITINEKLITNENDTIIETRIPFTVGDSAKFIQIPKDSLKKLDNEKTILTSININGYYQVFDSSGKAETVRGSELYKNYDAVNRNVDKNYSNSNSEKSKDTKDVDVDKNINDFKKGKSR